MTGTSKNYHLDEAADRKPVHDRSFSHVHGTDAPVFRCALTKLLVVATLLLAIPQYTNAETRANEFDAFLSAGYVFPVGVVVYPGIGYTFVSTAVGDRTVLSFGATVAGQIATAAMALPWSYTSFGAGFLGTVSISFPGMSDRPLIRNLTLSIAPGIGFNAYSYGGDPAYYSTREKFRLEFAGIASIRYRMTSTFAVGLDFHYWGKYIGPNLGLGVQMAL
jgi:hypothetical protein